MKWYLLVSLVMLPWISEARIGGTLEECVALYGESQGSQDGTHVFMNGELVYVCGFNQETKLCNNFMVATKIKLPLTTTEVKTILKENPGYFPNR